MQGKINKKDNPDRLPLGKFFAWRAGAFSLAGNFILMGYVMIYCTDMLKMPAELVGSILLASKIIDAVLELYAGYYVDRTKSRLGKGRPWDLCLIGLWISTVLLFATPVGASLVAKAIWIFTMYMFVQSIFQTLAQAGSIPYMMRAFRNKNVIVKVQSYGGVVGMVLSIGLSVLLPKLVKSMGTSPSGWTLLVTLVAVPLLLLGLTRFIFVKEIYEIQEPAEEKIKIKDVLKTISGNKYIWLVCGITLAMQIISGMNAGTYYFTYIVGDISKLGTLQIVSIAILPLMFIFPKIIKKFSISTVIAAGAVMAVLGCIIAFFSGSSMMMLMAAEVIKALGMLAPPYLITVMIMDCAKYNLWKGNASLEASLAAFNSFASNVGTGLGSALVGFLLGAAGYVGGAATQNPETLLMIRLLYSLIPGVLFALMYVFARLFKLDKMMPQIDKDIEERSANQVA